MGVYIKIPNVTFTKYIGIAEIEDEPIIPDVPDEPTVPDIYPVTDTLKGLYYLGGTADESLVNHANGDIVPTIPSSATVTFADGYASFDGAMNADRISTNVNVSPENGVTMVALFRVPTGKRSILSTNQNSVTGKGVTFTNDRAYAYIGGTGGQHLYPNGSINTSNFVLCAFTASVDGVRAVKSENNGGVTELLTVAGVVDVWSASAGVTIGGGQQNLSYGDPADIALVSIHEGDVTDEQLQQIFEHVRWYGESKGLTIE